MAVGSGPQVVLTYCGVVDDFAMKHAGGVKSIDDLNRQLLFAVLFGDGLLVNDGYVVMHPAIRRAVLKPDSSPFRRLVEDGYIKILTRNDGELGTLPELMWGAGITAAKGKAQDKKANQQFGGWSKNLHGDFAKCFVRWPKKDTSAIFRKIAGEAHAAAVETHADLADELAAFEKAVSTTKGRRTEWEDTANRLVTEGALSTRGRDTLMQVANDAYQYSWGCALDSGSVSVRVQTRVPRYVMLDQVAGELATDRREAVLVLAPNLALARKRAEGNWNVLGEAARDTDAVQIAKRDFLDKLRLYYASDKVDENQMRAAAKAYSAVLSDRFKSKKLSKVTFRVGFPVAAGATAFVFAGPVGAAAGVLVGIFGAASEDFGGQFISRLTGGTGTWLREETVRSPGSARSSFEMDHARARAVLKGIPDFT